MRTGSEWTPGPEGAQARQPLSSQEAGSRPPGGTVDGHCPSAGGMQANPGADGSRAWSRETQGPGPTLGGASESWAGSSWGWGVPAFFCRKHFCLYLVNWVGWGHHPSTDEETESRETRDLPDPWHLSAHSLAPGLTSSHTSLQATRIPQGVPVLTPQGSSSAKRDIIQAGSPLSDRPHLPAPWSWKRHWEDTRGSNPSPDDNAWSQDG